MMRKVDGRPGIPAIRLLRVPLTALAMILTFLLGGAATVPDAAAADRSAPGNSALRPVGGSPAINTLYNKNKDTNEREVERGQHRRTSRTAVGVPQHPGRLLPPCRSDVTTPMPTARPGPYRTGAATSPAAGREQLPLLHCVFLC